MNKQYKIVICNFARFPNDIWLPVLWANAKTYYERNGIHRDQWHWIPAEFDVYSSEHEELIKQRFLEILPDIFAMSLYVWNYQLSFRIAKWIKQVRPQCMIVTGGPHQHFKHDIEWFKKHPYIDASLPGECYGELCFQEILDNYSNGSVDWECVTDIRYPLKKSRMLTASTLTMRRAQKKEFDYNWSAVDQQLLAMHDFINHKNYISPSSRIMSILETTRGCPYGCTYCDWGGGIATTVIKKTVDAVKKDIDALSRLNLHTLYIADANFGIHGQRDIEIIEYIASKTLPSGGNFKVFYGGFAKTENRLNDIKKIVEIDLDNHLNHHDEIKLGIQSLDPEVLANIDRINIPYHKQIAAFSGIAADKKIPMYGEIILGLPGMDLDKFYYELTTFAQDKLGIQWYPWLLLPETPAYARDYRQKFGIKTILNQNGWVYDEPGSEYEVVIQTSSYTDTDYLQMLLSTSLYNLLVQGGFYQNTMLWIQNNHDIGTGDLIRTIYEEYYQQTEFYQTACQEWYLTLANPNARCAFSIDSNLIYGTWYFIALAFLQHQQFSIPMNNWLQARYKIPYNIVQSDNKIALHKDCFQTLQQQGFNTVDYRKNIKMADIAGIIQLFQLYRHSGKIFQGTKRILGLVPT